MTGRSLIARQRASGRSVGQTPGTGKTPGAGKAGGGQAYRSSSLKSLPVLGLTK
ncbi:MAG: hypothetical protein WA268_09745 [Xanthobacteraceae bacterium]